MAKVRQNERLQSGNKKTLTFTITGEDITGSTPVWKLYPFKSDVAVLSKSLGSGLTITNAASGVLQITLDAADTTNLGGHYRHELQITDASSNVNTVSTGLLYIYDSLIA